MHLNVAARSFYNVHAFMSTLRWKETCACKEPDFCNQKSFLMRTIHPLLLLTIKWNGLTSSPLYVSTSDNYPAASTLCTYIFILICYRGLVTCFDHERLATHDFCVHSSRTCLPNSVFVLSRVKDSEAGR